MQQSRRRSKSRVALPIIVRGGGHRRRNLAKTFGQPSRRREHRFFRKHDAIELLHVRFFEKSIRLKRVGRADERRVFEWKIVFRAMKLAAQTACDFYFFIEKWFVFIENRTVG